MLLVTLISSVKLSVPQQFSQWKMEKIVIKFKYLKVLTQKFLTHPVNKLWLMLIVKNWV